jgi:D-alanyl-D-alanine carboxypeptidase
LARRLALLVLAGILAATLVAQPAGAVKADPSGATLKRVLKRLTKIPTGPPGAIAIVQRHGERRMVVKTGFGNLAPTERPHPTDHMRIASVSKAFSGAVALALVSEGRLTLDTTIGERLPDMPSQFLGVSLRDLLNHTSGIPSYTTDPAFQADLGANPQAQFSHRALIDYVADDPLKFAPGTSYAYSNTDNIIVALMAEAATGETYENLLATRVLAPLGMHDTTLPSDSAIPEPFIHGYDIGEDTPPDDVSNALGMSSVWASGAILSTPADLNRFTRGYVGGRLFDQEERSAQFQFFAGGASDPPGPGDNSAGLALFKYKTPCGTVFGHTGSFPGYTQFIGATRNGRTSVTVSVNEQLGPEAGDPVVFQRLLKAEKTAVCTALARAH